MVEFGREARRWTGCCCLAVLLSGLCLSPAGAVIEALTSLEKFVADADLILVANVKQLDLEKGRLVLAVENRLKGDDTTALLPVRLGGNANEALSGVSQGDIAVLFISRAGQQNLAYGYVGGAWFHMIGSDDQGTVRWQFKAGEPYLRRSYSDETSKLIELITANQAGTGGLPAPDATIPSGYGLVIGMHPAPQVVKTVAVATSPTSAANPPLFNWNAVLAIVAACCACVLAFMLVRSVPVEDADV
jgi:hypothetical protein